MAWGLYQPIRQHRALVESLAYETIHADDDCRAFNNDRGQVPGVYIPMMKCDRTATMRKLLTETRNMSVRQIYSDGSINLKYTGLPPLVGYLVLLAIAWAVRGFTGTGTTPPFPPV